MAQPLFRPQDHWCDKITKMEKQKSEIEVAPHTGSVCDESTPNRKNETKYFLTKKGRENELLYTRIKKECLPEDHESESNDGSCDSASDFDALDADFEFFDPHEKFYHTIRHFFTESILMGLNLREYSEIRPNQKRQKREQAQRGNKVNGTSQPVMQETPLASRLADCVSEQGNIGTVVCVATHQVSQLDSPVGFATILNFKQYFDNGLKNIQLSLLNAARKRLDSRRFRTFKNILDPNPEFAGVFSRNKLRIHKKKGIPLPVSAGGAASIVGLFLNERLVNLPHEIAPKLLENLHQDVLWSQTTPTCPEEERQYYFFTHLVGLSHCFVLKKQEVKQTATELTQLGTTDYLFRKFEDEIFVEHSVVHFTIPTSFMSRVPSNVLENSETQLVDAVEHRLVFLIEYLEFVNAIKKCEDVLEKQGSYAQDKTFSEE